MSSDEILRFELPGATEPVTLSMPAAWLGAWVQPAEVVPASDALLLIEKALDRPVGCPTLPDLVKPGETVALVVDDVTRRTPAYLVLPPLLSRLMQAGIAESNIRIVIALGSHRLMTQQEMNEKLGPEICGRFQVVQSNCTSQEEMRYLGLSSNGIPAWVHEAVVEADFRIGIGMITPHMDAGFSGGAKIILPGVCGVQTVDAFHIRSMDDLENPLGNPDAPLRLALEQFVQDRLPLHFIVNLILTPQEKIFQCVAGHVVAAHRLGVRYARQVYGAPVQRRYPVVVANCAPYQHDLWQSCKGLWCGDLLTADQGSLVWATQSPEGAQNVPLLPQYIGGQPEDLRDCLDEGEILDPKAAATGMMIGRKKQRIQISLVSAGLTRTDAQRMGLCDYPTVEEAVAQAVNRLPESERRESVAVIPQAGIIIPRFPVEG